MLVEISFPDGRETVYDRYKDQDILGTRDLIEKYAVPFKVVFSDETPTRYFFPIALSGEEVVYTLVFFSADNQFIMSDSPVVGRNYCDEKIMLSTFSKFWDIPEHVKDQYAL